jgi:hypothetical protein
MPQPDFPAVVDPVTPPGDPEDPKETPEPQATSLADVHAQALEELDDEESGEEEEETEEVEDPEDPKEDPKDPKTADPKPGEKVEITPPKEEETLSTDEIKERRDALLARVDEMKAIDADTDITKPGEGKVAFKDAEGKTYYIKDEDQLPDDYEPASYKEMLKAQRELVNSQNSWQQKIQDIRSESEELVEEEEKAQRITDLHAAWDTEIKELKDAGRITDDKTINEVYALMGEWNAKGKTIPSFEMAFEMWEAKQGKSTDAEDKKKRADLKKKKGGKVLGTHSSSKKTGPIEGPPSGTSLDDLHAQVMNELQ